MNKALTVEATTNLYAIIPLILAHAASSQMLSWCGSKGESWRPPGPSEDVTICNTELCVGGWLVYMDKNQDLAALVEMTDAEIEARANQLLGFEPGTCGLFYITHWPRGLKEIYEQSAASPEARAHIMAFAIRRFAGNPLAFAQDSGWYNDAGEPSSRRDW